MEKEYFTGNKDGNKEYKLNEKVKNTQINKYQIILKKWK